MVDLPAAPKNETNAMKNKFEANYTGKIALRNDEEQLTPYLTLLALGSEVCLSVCRFAQFP